MCVLGMIVCLAAAVSAERCFGGSLSTREVFAVANMRDGESTNLDTSSYPYTQISLALCFTIHNQVAKHHCIAQPQAIQANPAAFTTKPKDLKPLIDSI